jgi:hypothetical protein
MSAEITTIPLWEEIAEFMASRPTDEEVLAFRPSGETVERARELLFRGNAGELTSDEQWELTTMEQAEMLMRLVKARLRARNSQVV